MSSYTSNVLSKSSMAEKYEVEAIRDYRLNLQLSRFEFLTKWARYAESSNTWEPAESFMDGKSITTIPFDTFLTDTFPDDRKPLRKYALLQKLFATHINRILDDYEDVKAKIYGEEPKKRTSKSSKESAATPAKETKKSTQKKLAADASSVHSPIVAFNKRKSLRAQAQAAAKGAADTAQDRRSSAKKPRREEEGDDGSGSSSSSGSDDDTEEENPNKKVSIYSQKFDAVAPATATAVNTRAADAPQAKGPLRICVPCFVNDERGFFWRYLTETPEQMIADAAAFNEELEEYKSVTIRG